MGKFRLYHKEENLERPPSYESVGYQYQPGKGWAVGSQPNPGNPIPSQLTHQPGPSHNNVAPQLPYNPVYTNVRYFQVFHIFKLTSERSLPYHQLYAITEKYFDEFS